MKAINKKIFLIGLVLLSLDALSQQLPQFSQYMFNTVSINPAYAGSRGVLSIVGLHRSQWVGIEGVPNTQTLSIHTPLKNERTGLGLSIINDSPGYENLLYMYGDFSYTIPLGGETKLAFGLKGGFTYYNLDNDFKNDPQVVGDPFYSNFNNRWNPNLGIGTYLHTNRWYLGLSAPRILNTDYNITNNSKGIEYVASERVSYYFIGGYVFNLNSALKFKPSFLVKATNGAPLSVDLNATFLIKDRLWLGGGYRYNQDTTTFGGLLDFQVSDTFRVGYAYETFTGTLRPYTGGTHEIILIMELQKKVKRVKSPRYF